MNKNTEKLILDGIEIQPQIIEKFAEYQTLQSAEFDKLQALIAADITNTEN